MFLSMTGFSSKTVTLTLPNGEKISLLIELKTINSRFFEVVCKLPSFLSHLEIKIIQTLKEKLLRGRVYLTVRLTEEDVLLERVVPSLKLIEEYVKAIGIIKKKLKISGELEISDVIHIPNVFVTEKESLDPKTQQAILKVVENLSEQLIKDRSEEGKRLQKDLEKRFLICSKKMVQVESFFEKMMKIQKEKVKDMLLSQQQGDENAKIKLDELYAFLNKIDIHEEIVRFKSHLENIKKVLKDSDVEKGKRLDFILQELVRESNTILAKCSNFEISSVSVDIKVELEKAREQSQNVV